MTKEESIAVYLRLSLEDEGMVIESNSITNQRFLIHDYIFQNEDLSQAEIIEYIDDGYSGSNFERPSIRKLLEDVQRKKIQCIIVKDLSRFSRDHIELGTYMELIFPFMDVRFISINDQYDSGVQHASSINMETYFKTLLYDIYSKELSESVKASIEEKCNKGEYAFGQLPFGYERIQNSNNQIQICEKEEKVISRIFAMALEKQTSTQIARQFNIEKIPTARQIRGIKKVDKDIQYKWTSTMIRNILKNRFYIGEWSYHKTTREVGGKKVVHVPKEEWTVVPNHHKNIVSMETFQQVQVSADSKSKKQVTTRHPLIGKVYCGSCHYAMVYKRYYKYKRFECAQKSVSVNTHCCSYFNAIVLEEIILVELKKVVLQSASNYKLLEVYRETLNKGITSIKMQLRKVKQKSRKIERQRWLCYEEYATKRNDSEIFKEKYAVFTKQIDELCYHQNEVENKLNGLKELYKKNMNDIKDLICYTNIIELNRNVIEIFVRKIYLYKDKRIAIEWNFRQPDF